MELKDKSSRWAQPIIKIPGGMWEEPGAATHFNVDVWGESGIEPCKHCGPVFLRWHTRSDGTMSNADRHFICPRVVVATNEGGHATTGVCLDCILEAVPDLPSTPDLPYCPGPNCPRCMHKECDRHFTMPGSPPCTCDTDERHKDHRQEYNMV